MQPVYRIILLIDRDPAWILFAKEILQRNDFLVYAVDNIVAAQQQVDSMQDKIALTLADARLLEGDVDAITYLRQSGSEMPRPIIALFASGLAPQKVRILYKEGVADCVRKPFAEADLLALVERALADYRATKVTLQQNHARSKKVLVVDDDSDWLSILVRYLPDAVEQIEKATDYRQAIEKIYQQKFDLVILDLRLSAEDDSNSQGIELIQAMREQDSKQDYSTEIIIVSAFGTSEQIQAAFREQNINYYFAKQSLSPVKYREQVAAALSA